MDALNEQDAPRAQPDVLPIVLPQARYKIEFRYRHLLAGKDLHDVRFHEGMVHRVKIIEVEAAVRETRRIGPVHEIIVGRY